MTTEKIPDSEWSEELGSACEDHKDSLGHFPFVNNLDTNHGAQQTYSYNRNVHGLPTRTGMWGLAVTCVEYVPTLL